MFGGKCKICGKEGSVFNIFDPYEPDLQMHERCMERELDKGNLGVLGEMFGRFFE